MKNQFAYLCVLILFALKSAVGCWLCVHGARMFTPARLSREESIVMLLFSVLYTINIVCTS